MTYQEILQGLLDALNDLKTAVTKHGYTPNYGICGEIDTYWDARFGELSIHTPAVCLQRDSPAGFLGDIMLTWPHSTGSTLYPVPAARGCPFLSAASQAFSRHAARWVGEQLELRLELIDYLLNELSDRLEANRESAP